MYRFAPIGLNDFGLHQPVEYRLVYVLTAKTPRARREDAMHETDVAIEQIADPAVDAMLKVHTLAGLGPGLRTVSRRLKRAVP